MNKAASSERRPTHSHHRLSFWRRRQRAVLLAGLLLLLLLLLIDGGILFVHGLSIQRPPIFMSTSSTMDSSLSTSPRHFVGFDFGTSGARMSIIAQEEEEEGSNQAHQEIYSDSISWTESNPYDDPSAWVDALQTLLTRSATNDTNLLAHVQAVCVSGTSASCLLVQSTTGRVSRPPRMYDYDIFQSDDPAAGPRVASRWLERYAPPRHTTRARTSSLAKLLLWNEEQILQPGERLCHQADYLGMVLRHGPYVKKCGSTVPTNQRLITSDWHNCLKLGYDVRSLAWPDWLGQCLTEATGNRATAATDVLPSLVVSPGQPVGTVHESFGDWLPPSTVVVAGTTDSNAAFLAAVGNVDQVPWGTAVTSLGSTLAMKQLSRTFCEDATRGVYSHRFPSPVNSDDNNHDAAWLVGGASNVGCAILRQEGFTNDELERLSLEMEEEEPLDQAFQNYYPLCHQGERFPVADGNKLPVLEPKPARRRDYLKAILYGIARVEREGFDALGELGASPPRPTKVYTAGGGAKNDAWMRTRQRELNREGDGSSSSSSIKVERAANTEASFGAAILAATTFR